MATIFRHNESRMLMKKVFRITLQFCESERVTVVAPGTTVIVPVAVWRQSCATFITPVVVCATVIAQSSCVYTPDAAVILWVFSNSYQQVGYTFTCTYVFMFFLNLFHFPHKSLNSTVTAVKIFILYFTGSSKKL